MTKKAKKVKKKLEKQKRLGQLGVHPGGGGLIYRGPE